MPSFVLISAKVSESLWSKKKKTWLLEVEGTLGGPTQRHCVQMSAAAVIQPVQLTHSLDLHGSSEGDNKRPDAGVNRVAKELHGGWRRRKAGGMSQGCCPEQLGKFPLRWERWGWERVWVGVPAADQELG